MYISRKKETIPAFKAAKNRLTLMLSIYCIALQITVGNVLCFMEDILTKEAIYIANDNEKRNSFFGRVMTIL